MKHISFDQNNWEGRIDHEDGELGLRIHQIIKPYDESLIKNSKVILGFSSEEGVKRNKGRIGAKDAPNIIRKALANLPVHFKNNNIYDMGNIIVQEKLEQARTLQIDKILEILHSNNLPVVIGGGHETALGNYLGFVEKYPHNSAVINLDAHFDLRLPNEHSTSGTPFFEMYQYSLEHNLQFNYLAIGIQELGNTKALFKRADELHVNYIIADELHANFKGIIEQLKEYITQFDHIYLSLDMDVFDLSYAPGVSAPTINGLTPFQVKYILKLLYKSGKLKIMDVVETNPHYDRDNQTAKLAAQMIYEVLRD